MGDDGHGATERARFEVFFTDAEPRLRRALVAAYGGERGREATAEALAWAWERWDDVSAMANPVGYLYRVGQSRTRDRKGRVTFAPPDAPPDQWVEPELGRLLAELPERQRTCVVLVHGFGWTLREVAELLGTSISTVQKHVERAMTRLQSALEVHT